MPCRGDRPAQHYPEQRRPGPRCRGQVSAKPDPIPERLSAHPFVLAPMPVTHDRPRFTHQGSSMDDHLQEWARSSPPRAGVPAPIAKRKTGNLLRRRHRCLISLRPCRSSFTPMSTAGVYRASYVLTEWTFPQLRRHKGPGGRPRRCPKDVGFLATATMQSAGAPRKRTYEEVRHNSPPAFSSLPIFG